MHHVDAVAVVTQLSQLSLENPKYSKYRNMTLEDPVDLYEHCFGYRGTHSNFYYFCKLRISHLALKIIKEAASTPSFLIRKGIHKKSAFDAVRKNRDETIFIPFVACLLNSKDREAKEEVRKLLGEACQNKLYDEVALFIKALKGHEKILFHGYKGQRSPLHTIIRQRGDGKNQKKYEVVLEYLRLLKEYRKEHDEVGYLISQAVEVNNLEAVNALKEIFGLGKEYNFWVIQSTPEYSPIHRAYKLGHTESILLYIKGGEDVSCFFASSFFHLLCKSVRLEDIALVKALLERISLDTSSELHDLNEEGMTGLQLACASRNNSIIQLFIDRREKWPLLFAETGRIGKTPLEMICESNNVDGFRLYFSGTEEQVASRLKQVDPTLHNLLHRAYVSDAKDVVREIFLLLSRDETFLASVDRQGNTAFHYAATFGDVGAFSYYSTLKTKELYFAKNRIGNTPLHTACKKGQVDFIRAYILHCKSEKELLWSKNTYEQTALLVALDAEIDPAAKEEIAALLLQNSDDLPKQLLEKDSNGYLLLRTGSMVGCLPIIQAYIHYFAKDPTQLLTKDYRGRCPLHYIAMHEDASCFQEFIKVFSPDIDALFIKDNDGNTPLHLAAEKGSRKILQIYFTRTLGREELLFEKNIAGTAAFDILTGDRKNSDIVIDFMKHTQHLLFTDSSSVMKLFDELLDWQLVDAALWIFENIKTTTTYYEEMEKRFFFKVGSSASYERVKPWITKDPGKFLTLKNALDSTILETGSEALIAYCVTTWGASHTDLFFQRQHFDKTTPLINACINNQREVVAAYFANDSTKLRLKDERYFDQTVFQVTFARQSFSVLDLIIEKSGGSLNALLKEVNTRRWVSSLSSNADRTAAYFKHLSKYPEMLFLVDENDNTPLQKAYKKNLPAIVDMYFEFMEQHPQFWEVECATKSTIFELAAKREDIAMLQKIVDALKDKKGLLHERSIIRRSLLYAVNYEKVKLGQFLLGINSRRAHSLCVPDSLGESFIHLSARRGLVELLETYKDNYGKEQLLKENTFKQSPLQIVATALISIMKSNPEQIECFVRTISFLSTIAPRTVHPFLLVDTSHVPGTPTSMFPKTVLHTACTVGCLPIVETFLKEAIDSDIEAQSLFKYHPLTIAVENGHEEIIALYMNKDIKHAYVVNCDGTNTPFQRAFELRNKKIITLFFSYLEKDPATFFTQGKDGKTVLHFACKSGDIDTIHKCIKIAGDEVRFLGMQDEEGNTPLHLIPYSDIAFDLIDKLQHHQDILFRQNKKKESCLHLFVARDLKRAKDRVMKFAEEKYLLLKNTFGQTADEVTVIKSEKKKGEDCSIS